MGLLNKRKSNSNNKDDGRSKGDRNRSQVRSKSQSETNERQTIYVNVSSHKAIFLVTGKPKEAKYSYGVPIIPLHGYYYSPKQKRTFKANELRDYYVILNVPKDVDKVELDEMTDAKVVIAGYYSYEIYLEEPEEEEEGESEENEEDEKKTDVKKGERNGGTKKK